MTNELAHSADECTPAKLRPGYLLAPLGWAAERLLNMLGSEPALAPQALQLSRARMHLIALAFAHGENERQQLDAKLLLHGSLGQVIDMVLKRRPAGLKRALEHLPVQVLPAETYRYLVELLEEPEASKIIHHADSLTRDYLHALHRVPQPLHRIIAVIGRDRSIDLEGFADGLRLLVSRGAAESFDALVAELAATRQPAQLLARIKSLVLALPYPAVVPPAEVGGARRLDDIDQIHRLGKQWKNCLSTVYVVEVIECRAAVYLWPDAEAPAVCAVLSCGRLGWGLTEAKGPENAELPAKRLAQIHQAFAAAGMPRYSSMQAVQSVMQMDSPVRRRRNRRQPDDEAEYEAAYAEFEAALR